MKLLEIQSDSCAKLPLIAQLKMLPWPIYALLSIFIIGFISRVFFIGTGSLWPDEALYLFISRNLASDPMALHNVDGKLFFQNPPLFLYVLSILFKVFSNSAELAARFLNALLGALTILLVYRVGKSQFEEGVGIIAALLLAVNPLHLWTSSRILMDVPVTFLIYLSIYFLSEGKKAFFYISAAASCLTKYPALPLLVLPFLKEARIKNSPKLYSLLYFLGIGLMSIYITVNVKPNLGILTELLRFFGFPNYPEMIHETSFFLNNIVLVFSLFGFFLCLKNKKFNQLVIWFLLFGAARFFLPWMAFRMSRYTLPLYPALILLASYGGLEMVHFLRKKFATHSLMINLLFAGLLFYVVSISASRAYMVTDLTARTFVGFNEVQMVFKDKPPGLSIITASPRQVKYYAPQMNVLDLSSESSNRQIQDLIFQKQINYVMVDRWSPHQPRWAAGFFQAEKGFKPVYSSPYLTIYETIHFAKP
jgi:4-amino-4-deoxy-L-arabinose transferase-like glycosyltransferase